jgi:hypothetical protein
MFRTGRRQNKPVEFFASDSHFPGIVRNDGLPDPWLAAEGR